MTKTTGRGNDATGESSIVESAENNAPRIWTCLPEY